MFLPLGTDRPLTRPTTVNYVLIGANLLIHIAMALLASKAPDLHNKIFTTLWIDGQNFKWWGLITSCFLHGGWMHVLGNMLFLFVFGGNVEDRFGRVWYLVFYLVGGMAASGTHALLEINPAIGASGAVSAVSGAYLVLFPKTRIRVILFFMMFWVPAAWFIGFGLFWDIVLVQASHGVARLAHLGGYGFGISVALFLLWRRILDREPYDLFTLFKQAHRRRQFREVGLKQQAQVEKHWKKKAEDPAATRLAESRAQVAACVERRDLDQAVVAYRSLVDTYADKRDAITLSRDVQYAVANELFGTGDHQLASVAYEVFLEAYPTDTEVPDIKLMLGLINARYLNDPVTAKRLIGEAIEGLSDADRLALAKQELEDLG